MILIGMFDSPFVRRVAVSMNLLSMPFEHRNWSIGKDFELIREYNPLGRVPTLVLSEGEVLVESAAILDYLDDISGPNRALLPGSGALRRQALQLMALASGAAEKGVSQLYEMAFRPEAKRHAPWVQRCREQMHAALAELDRICAIRAGKWLVGDGFSQADITCTCVFTFLSDALGANIATAGYPALNALAARCEAMPEFKSVRVPWFVPGAAPPPS